MKKSLGSTSVEFALVSMIFLVMLIAVLEVSRVLFFWNTLTEATRRAARMAVICPPNDPAIFKSALFAENNANSNILADITESDFTLEYLDRQGNTISQPNSDYQSISFVTVAMRENRNMPILIPGIDQLLTFPRFSTTLPIESLGVSRDNTSAQCQGSDQ